MITDQNGAVQKTWRDLLGCACDADSQTTKVRRRSRQNQPEIKLKRKKKKKKGKTLRLFFPPVSLFLPFSTNCLFQPFAASYPNLSPLPCPYVICPRLVPSIVFHWPEALGNCSLSGSATRLQNPVERTVGPVENARGGYDNAMNCFSDKLSLLLRSITPVFFCCCWHFILYFHWFLTGIYRQ